jgi:predicted anti-sigma-YlaC factor YlaD
VQACEFRDTSGVLNFLNCIKSTGAANTVDGLTVTDTNWHGLGTTSVGSFILTANDIDRLTLQRNIVILKTTVDAPIYVNVTAGVLTNLYADTNAGYRLNTATTGGSFTNVGGTTSTGIVSCNYMQTKTTTSDLLFTTTVGLAAFENRVSGVTGATGFVIPAADS